jgi:hypothetical protein
MHCSLSALEPLLPWSSIGAFAEKTRSNQIRIAKSLELRLAPGSFVILQVFRAGTKSLQI